MQHIVPFFPNFGRHGVVQTVEYVMLVCRSKEVAEVDVFGSGRKAIAKALLKTARARATDAFQNPNT